MSQIVNWICLISVTLLILDIMIYFCNDAIRTYNRTTKIKTKPIEKPNTYVYQEKIAK